MADRRLAACACGTVNEQHDSASRRAPRDGDLSICWTCHQLSCFDLKYPGGLRPLTDEERTQLVRRRRQP